MGGLKRGGLRMARKKQGRELGMVKIREILRLRLKCGIGLRDIARSLAISHPTVSKYLGAVQKAGLNYAQMENMDDKELKKRLKEQTEGMPKEVRPLPDWGYIYRELKRKDVTLQLLWEEYKGIHPNGYQSSQFNEYYLRWLRRMKKSMRQTHKAGEKGFVDYAGHTIPIYDRQTGKIRQAEILVMSLGASNYTYCEAQEDRTLANWIEGHARAFEYFKGVPRILVPDNLKTGVSKPCRYEPEINAVYSDMAAHYGTVVIPARVKKPKDKAKVEVGVQIVSRWILARLRNRKFFNLAELNAAIKELLEVLNGRAFKKLQGCRRSWFEEIEQKELLPLPEERYEFCEWKRVKIGIDTHVDINGHYYSVPYKLREMVEYLSVKCTASTVEIFHDSQRVASHKRDDQRGRHTTVKEHLPPQYQEYLGWSCDRIIKWASGVGNRTAELVEAIMRHRGHPMLGWRSCLGIIRLGRDYPKERIEAACARALVIKGYSYKSVESILKRGLDRQPLSKRKAYPIIRHENIRGGEYFNQSHN